MYWAVEYTMIPINYLCCLSLELGTYYISFEEEAGDINLTRLNYIHVNIRRNIFYALHMPTLFTPPPPCTSS